MTNLFSKTFKSIFDKTIQEETASVDENPVTPPIPIEIPKITDKNTLVFSQAGSGKTYVLTTLVAEHLKAKQKVFIFGNFPAFARESTEFSYFDLESAHFTKAKVDNLTPPWSNFELPSSFYEQDFDVIVIDDPGLLCDQSLKDLCLLIQNKPEIKFVLAIQSSQKKYNEIIRYFDDAYIGYYNGFRALPELSEFLGIEHKEIEICRSKYFREHQKFLKVKPRPISSQKDNYRF